MKDIIKLILLILWLYPFQSSAIGWGDWENKTANGTRFVSPGGTVIILPNHETYKYAVTWYFYKDHIIGIGNTYGQERRREFFVIDENENKETIHTFETEERWQAFIDVNNLEPLVWTRWFTDDWDLLESLVWVAYFAFPLVVMVILMNGYLFYKFIRVDSWPQKIKWGIGETVHKTVSGVINHLET